MESLHVGDGLSVGRIGAQKVRARSVESVAKDEGLGLVVGEYSVKGLDFGRVKHALAFHDFNENFLQLEVQGLVCSNMYEGTVDVSQLRVNALAHESLLSLFESCVAFGHFGRPVKKALHVEVL